MRKIVRGVLARALGADLGSRLGEHRQMAMYGLPTIEAMSRCAAGSELARILRTPNTLADRHARARIEGDVDSWQNETARTPEFRAAWAKGESEEGGSDSDSPDPAISRDLFRRRWKRQKPGIHRAVARAAGRVAQHKEGRMVRTLVPMRQSEVGMVSWIVRLPLAPRDNGCSQQCVQARARVHAR